jgi:hypothetical protein
MGVQLSLRDRKNGCLDTTKHAAKRNFMVRRTVFGVADLQVGPIQRRELRLLWLALAMLATYGRFSSCPFSSLHATLEWKNAYHAPCNGSRVKAQSSVSELTLSTHYGRRTKSYLAVRFQDAVVIHSRSVASGQLWPLMATHCTSEAALHARPVQVAYGSRMHRFPKLLGINPAQLSDTSCYRTVCCSAPSGLPGCRGWMRSIAFVMIW